MTTSRSVSATEEGLATLNGLLNKPPEKRALVFPALLYLAASAGEGRSFHELFEYLGTFVEPAPVRFGLCRKAKAGSGDTLKALGRRQIYFEGAVAVLRAVLDGEERRPFEDDESEGYGGWDPVPIHCARVTVSDAIKWKNCINTRDATLPHFIRGAAQRRCYVKSLADIARLNGIVSTAHEKQSTRENNNDEEVHTAPSEAVANTTKQQPPPPRTRSVDSDKQFNAVRPASSQRGVAAPVTRELLPSIALQPPKPPPSSAPISGSPMSRSSSRGEAPTSSPRRNAASLSARSTPDRNRKLPTVLNPQRNSENAELMMSPASQQLQKWREGLARIAEDKERERKLHAVLRTPSEQSATTNNTPHSASTAEDRSQHTPPEAQQLHHHHRPCSTNLWKWWGKECSHAFLSISAARSVQAWWRALGPRQSLKVMRRGFTLMAACARKRLQEWKVERGESVLMSALPTDAEKRFLKAVSLGQLAKAQQILNSAEPSATVGPYHRQQRVGKVHPILSIRHARSGGIGGGIRSGSNKCALLGGGCSPYRRRGATSSQHIYEVPKNVNPKCRNEHGQGAINLAARNGQLAVLQWLHESLGLSLLSKSDDGRSAAGLAAGNGHLNILQYMHKKCDGVTTREIEGEIPASRSQLAPRRLDWNEVALAAAARCERETVLRWLAQDLRGPKSSLSEKSSKALKSRMLKLKH